MKTKNGNKQASLTNKLLMIAGLSAVIGLAGCQEEGPAEKAGKKIDRAAEKAERQIDQAAEKANKKIDNAKESAGNSADKAGEYISDSVITAKVKAAILGDSILRNSHIDVTTVNGVVKLSGTVDSEQSLGRAMEVAGSQKDVKSVETTLVVVEPSTM